MNDHCFPLDKMNGHCSCGPGLSCQFVPASTATSANRMVIYPGPGDYKYVIQLNKLPHSTDNPLTLPYRHRKSLLTHSEFFHATRIARDDQAIRNQPTSKLNDMADFIYRLKILHFPRVIKLILRYGTPPVTFLSTNRFMFPCFLAIRMMKKYSVTMMTVVPKHKNSAFWGG
ncbi:hypothetical protein KUTeg_003228 [Tegillarca granosa]|uniref:Uncharacterized protein n=1 Tax=Tegillarca granosa TaxID=220873 RepID=A0ABQ9FNC4_TEGGR|nr:hypothetical protein KUTeg_003228 [Tegillarca granosa]